MNTISPLSKFSKVVLAAAVFSAVVTGCNRKSSADQPTASSTSTDSSSNGGVAKDSNASASTATPTASDNSAQTAAAVTPGASTTASNSGSDSSGATAAGTSAAGTSGATTATASGTATAPSDPQIAEILMTANNNEISAGKMAESKTQNSKVKEFAKNMVSEHTDVNQQITTLAKKTKMSPLESDTSKTLKDDGAKTASSLKAMDGKGFDKAYIDSQVSDHEKVLTMIDNVLLPNAKDADVKKLLQKVRPSVNTHLEHAKTLQASMK